MASSGFKLASSVTVRQLRQPPSFLAPVLADLQIGQRQQISRFSTTPSPQAKGFGNKNRGVSALRRKYPKQPLSVANEPLPKPVLDPKRRTKLTADPDHGLWGFFPPGRQALMTPEEMAQHGRSWSVEELRSKSWEDLHALWWVCAKERNMIATQEWERIRLKAGYGEFEASERTKIVRKTQKSIKHVLTERWYAYQNAVKLAAKKPELLSNSAWEDIEEDDISAGEVTASADTAGPATIPEESKNQQDRVRV